MDETEVRVVVIHRATLAKASSTVFMPHVRAYAEEAIKVFNAPLPDDKKSPTTDFIVVEVELVSGFTRVSTLEDL